MARKKRVYTKEKPKGTGKLSESVARGEAKDAKGKYRSPMPKSVLEKLKGMGVVTGGGSNKETIDPRFEPDLYDIEFERPGYDADQDYKNGGFVRVKRKSSFKGVF